MDKMSNEQIWEFAKELAKKLYEIDEYWLDKELIRTRDITISMYYLSCLAEAESEGYEEDYEGRFEYSIGWYESEDKLEDIVPRVAEDESIEAVMFCEGELWELLYYCEAYGSKDKRTREIYESFVSTVAKNDLRYEWGSGTIFLHRLS